MSLRQREVVLRSQSSQDVVSTFSMTVLMKHCQASKTICALSSSGLLVTWTHLSPCAATPGSLTFTPVIVLGSPESYWNINPFRQLPIQQPQAQWTPGAMLFCLFFILCCLNIFQCFWFPPSTNFGWMDFPFPYFMSGGRTLALTISVQQTGRFFSS